MSADRVWWYDAMGCESTDDACKQNWDTIHIAALIPSAFSIIASVFIIIAGTINHGRYSMTFAAQLPIFISICDLAFELNHGGDHLHNVLTGYVSEGWLCQLFGGFKPFSINAQTAWTLGTAFYINRCIFNRKSKSEPSFGPKNAYLHLACWVRIQSVDEENVVVSETFLSNVCTLCRLTAFYRFLFGTKCL